MRGKHGLRTLLKTLVRNIPAYAGKTSKNNEDGKGLTEHPRVCGENNSRHFTQHIQVGTSPRMRGKPKEVIPVVRPPRNIPAYAGKTAACRLVPIAPAEHPRVCGENFRPVEGEKSAKGTSPRMRGKHPNMTSPLEAFGNIPAYAGKTMQHKIFCPPNWEHPRVCGENRITCSWYTKQPGTSPRMRGKPSPIPVDDPKTRNIPAYAGKTSSQDFKSKTQTEHPRVCGENRSAPRTPRRALRNIPAYAGKT